jgi:hypothetical protein
MQSTRSLARVKRQTRGRPNRAGVGASGEPLLIVEQCELDPAVSSHGVNARGARCSDVRRGVPSHATDDLGRDCSCTNTRALACAESGGSRFCSAGWGCAPCFSHRDEHLPHADHGPGLREGGTVTSLGSRQGRQAEMPLRVGLREVGGRYPCGAAAR